MGSQALEALCCPVSQEPYGSSGALRPRLLPCGHTVSHASLKSILKQDTSAAHTCPICRTHLPQQPAKSFPTNFAILDILPLLRLCSTPGASSQAISAAECDTDSDSEVDAIPAAAAAAGSSGGATHVAMEEDLQLPTPSAVAVAALFPTERWLQERADLPLRLRELLPALQGSRGGALVRHEAWAQLMAKYKLPDGALRLETNRRSGPSAARVALTQEPQACTGYLVGDSSQVKLSVLYSPSVRSGSLESAQREGTGLGAVADAASTELQQQGMSLVDTQAVVVPHVVLQLLPDVWQCMQPLVGYFVEDAVAADDPACPTPRVGLVYARQGLSLPEFIDELPAGGVTVTASQVVEILKQLTGMLAVLHERGLSTAPACTMTFSSVHLQPSDSPGQLSVSLAPWPCSARVSSYVREADARCVPPEGASGGDNPQKADIWRAAAVAAVALAADRLMFRDRKPSIGDILACLPGRVPSHLLIILTGCLQEDPLQRWTPARMQLHLALAAAQVEASTGIYDISWGASTQDQDPHLRSESAARDSTAFYLHYPRHSAYGMDVVLEGAALQAALTYERHTPLEVYESANDDSFGERHYGCIMCLCSIFCLAPLICLFVVIHIVL